MIADLQQRLVVSPTVTASKVHWNTRIPVDVVVRMVAQGISEADILQEYPQLKAAAIRAA